MSETAAGKRAVAHDGCRECGGLGDSIQFQRGPAETFWLCRNHGRQMGPRLASQGWQSQSRTTALSATGIAIRAHFARQPASAPAPDDPDRHTNFRDLGR